MEQLNHFSHTHLLSLIQLQPEHNNENSDKEDEDENEDDFVLEEPHVGKCNMCEEEIYTFHICFYNCKDCNYSLHTFCAQLPESKHNHPLHPGHNLTLSRFPPLYLDHREWRCSICQHRKDRLYNYYCYTCRFTMDVICATMSGQKMDHPSHPHQLQRFSPMIARCNACGNEHSGTFYHCTTCSCFRIHLDCALLPPKLLIQQSTKGNFIHSHLLSLVYSFPYIEKAAKFFPKCRVCEKAFDPPVVHYFYVDTYLWHYKCDKCRYYVHLDCATSRKEAFISSIMMPAGIGKTYKNFKDEDYTNLIHCPFRDESVNLVMHHITNKVELVVQRKNYCEMFNHPHPQILVDTLLNGSVSLHDPMKKVELLCDGCVRPITNVPFYKCSQHDSNFVLHEWCTRLPFEIQDYPTHPEHTLFLLSKVPEKLLGVFRCEICRLLCNGFAYGCMQCKYYIDIHCGFIPDVITHEAHPDHLLQRYTAPVSTYCTACHGYLREGFHCPVCNFKLHIGCALLLPKTIRHKYDKHPFRLRYYPAENHISEYFCEICELELNPTKWFYHCSMCALSMHTACAPLKLQYERSIDYIDISIFMYLNVKFGGTHEITNHPHPLTFAQGINDDGQCIAMILKCIPCKFAIHHRCVHGLIEGSYSGGRDTS